MKPDEETVASRYARALLEAARARGAAEQTGEELRGLLKGKGRAFSPLFGRFLDLVVEKKRAALLPLVAEAYARGLDEAQGTVRVRVKTARPLTAGDRRAMEERFAPAGGRAVIEESVDGSLLAGLEVRQGDWLFDSSLKRQLNNLKERLAG